MLDWIGSGPDTRHCANPVGILTTSIHPLFRGGGRRVARRVGGEENFENRMPEALQIITMIVWLRNRLADNERDDKRRKNTIDVIRYDGHVLERVCKKKKSKPTHPRTNTSTHTHTRTDLYFDNVV